MVEVTQAVQTVSLVQAVHPEGHSLHSMKSPLSKGWYPLAHWHTLDPSKAALSTHSLQIDWSADEHVLHKGSSHGSHTPLTSTLPLTQMQF